MTSHEGLIPRPERGVTLPRRLITLPETEERFPSVFVGRVGLGEYKDEAWVGVSQAGFTIIVKQTSYGLTGISVTPQEGYTIEALHIDKETKQPVWVPTHDHYEGYKIVRVAEDRGNLGVIPVDSPAWKQENMGNSGWRGGVVQVTNERTGETRYYAVGANFSGRPDSWNAYPALVELRVNDNALTQNYQELPPRSALS